MKLHIISDIHREKKTYNNFELPITDSDAIVMAGDIDNGFSKTSEYLKYIADTHNKKVFYVPGNNCLYGRKINDELDKWRLANVDGVCYLGDGISEKFMGFNFIGGVLWPLCQGMNRSEIVNLDMNKMYGKKDKRIFKNDGNIMTSFDHIKMTEKEVRWFEKSLSQNKKNIIVSHYAPSLASQHTFYPNDIDAGSHACDVEHLMNSYDINLWIHGHIHDPFQHFVGRTKVVANPVPPDMVNDRALSVVIDV